MNNRGTLLGQIIESPGASIIVFVIMLIFVIVSGFISGSHFEIYDLMSDFVSDYVIFEDKVVTVEEAINRFCTDKSVGAKLKVVLREHFAEVYGGGNAFALVSSELVKSTQINQKDYFEYTLISWHGFFPTLEENKFKLSSNEFFAEVIPKYNKISNPDMGNVKVVSFCGSKHLDLYVKKRGDI